MEDDTREVRYERLRPAQLVRERQATPLAYIPIGTLEWHGPHNPVGLDTLKAHALAIRCARETGGLVLPPLWYGESRELALMEANARDREQIAEAMGLPARNFAPGYMMTTHLEHALAYQRLLVHILLQTRSLGFRVAFIVAGHYPLIDHARAACAQFHQLSPAPKMVTWAFSGYELVRSHGFEVCGDHAGKWETSLLMALDPGMVDLAALEEHVPPVGVSNNGVETASAEFGEQALAAIVECVAAKAGTLLSAPERFQGHGGPGLLDREQP